MADQKHDTHLGADAAEGDERMAASADPSATARHTAEKKYTAKPWEVHHGVDVTGYPCFFIHDLSGAAKRDTDMHSANARLIAAAPDLLDALTHLERAIDGFSRGEDFYVRDHGLALMLARREAKEAILKAEGR
jgi:hypothetical protein